MNIYKNIRRLFRNDSGSIPVMTGVSLLLLVVAAGGAVDVSLLVKEKAFAQSMADNAVLAASADFKRERLGATGRILAEALVDKTVANSGEVQKYKVQTTYELINPRQFKVETTVSGTTEHFFLGIIGHPESDIISSASSIVNLIRAEIILVLDVSHSMLQGTLLDDMKAAAINFVNELDPYDGTESYISFTIIPFAENVNMGPASKKWLDPSDGLDFAPDFRGCFRHSDGRTVGSLQGYSSGDTIVSGDNVPLCPPATSEALLNATDIAQITDHINGLEVGLGTGSDTGLLWANRMLTNSWRNKTTFAATPFQPLGPHTQRFVVFLTDGRLLRFDEDQNGIVQLQNSNDIPINSKDVITSFKSKCDDLKANSTTKLFTIGYSDTGKVPQNLEDILSDCAEGAGKYFPAGTSDVDQIFSNIQAQIQDVYLTD